MDEKKDPGMSHTGATRRHYGTNLLVALQGEGGQSPGRGDRGENRRRRKGENSREKEGRNRRQGKKNKLDKEVRQCGIRQM